MSLSNEEIRDLAELAMLDLATLDEVSIKTNPERLEGPKTCILKLYDELRYKDEIIEELEAIIKVSSRPLTWGKPWQAYLPEFMREWFIPKDTDYCYHRPGRVGKCVFWDAYEDSWTDANGNRRSVPDAYCHHMSPEMNNAYGFLIDDQCKECGVRLLDYDDPDE